MTTYRQRGPGQAVKGGAGQEQAGCFHPGQPGNDALTDRDPPGEQLAGQRGAGAPRTPPDQRECPPFSLTSPEREKHGHRPCPRPECGYWWTGPSKGDPGVWLAQWYPDRRMGCENCGPWIRAQKAAAYLAKIGDQQLYQRIVPKDWDTTAKGLRRAAADYLQIPTPDQQRRVLVNKPRPGYELVADNQAAVEAAIAAYPAGCGMNVSASRAWQIAKPKAKPAEGTEPPKAQGYDLRYLVAAGLHLRQVTRDLGLYLEEAGRDGSGFLYYWPTDPILRRRLIRWGGLWDPTDARTRSRPEKRRRREAA